jgi:hypothetical protein
MTSKPAHQRASNWGAWLLLGFLGAGAFLDTVSNSIALVTWPVTCWGTGLVVFLWLTVELVARYRRPGWMFGGQAAVIRALGPKPRLFVVGVVAVLWIPRVGAVVGRAPMPDIEATFSPRSPVLGKVVPRLAADGSSAPVTIEIGIKNAGGTRASGAVMTIMFRRGLEARPLEGRWSQGIPIPGYGVFVFEDPHVPLYARSGRHIGAFQLQLPKKTDARELLASFELHGDFARKEGLLYYDRVADEYQAWNTATPNEALQVWSAHVADWNRAQ